MKRYGLLGKTLGHSFSKSFFTELFQEKGIDAIYSNFELPTSEEIPQLLKEDLSGLSVTIPYKESIIPFLDELSTEVRNIGAVNCVAFKNGKKIGYNTDTYGFQQSIKPFLTNKHERAIIIGTGGASKAIAYVLKQLGIGCIFISRNPKGDNQFGYDDINVHMLTACRLVVNCTPVGMYPNVDDCVPFPYEHLTADHLVVDIIYNPIQTKFLEQAKAAGAQILNGESMLKQQALMAWKIWNGEL